MLVVDDWGFSEPRTKDALEVLGALGLRTAAARARRRACSIVVDVRPHRGTTWKSFRNLGERVQLVLPNELNTYDILVNDWLVFSKATLEGAVARFGDKPSPERRRRRAPSEPTEHE